MTEATPTKNLPNTSGIAVQHLTARAVPALAAGVALLGDSDADAALAQLSAVYSQVSRSSRDLAVGLIREMLRLRFPSAAALELVSMGRVASETTFIPRVVLDQDGKVLWAYELLHARDRPADREWENVLAQHCDCLLSGDMLPAGSPAMDPAVGL